MRGREDLQGTAFYAINVEELISPNHPLRRVKRRVDAELLEMSKAFSAAYGKVGRPSIPPETLLKAMLLQALYSIRSERQLIERIGTDLLFRWFLDLSPAGPLNHLRIFAAGLCIGLLMSVKLRQYIVNIYQIVSAFNL